MACRKSRTCNCSITRSGVVTTTSQSEGISLPTIPGFPELPGLGGGSDTTTEAYSITTTEVTNYDKVSKRDMNASCPARSEEMIYDKQSTMAAGLYTSTVVDSGKKVRECTIE